MRLEIITICSLLCIISFIPPIFGHGIGGETLPPITIGDRNATVSLSILPESFSEEDEEQYINVRFFDSDTSAVIEHVSYIIELSKGDQRIFRHMFHDEFGNLVIKIKPSSSEDLKVSGNKEPLLDGWMRVDDYTPVTIEGLVFPSGGLYNFKVDILTLDSDNKILDERIVFNGAISIADKEFHKITGKDGKQYQLTTNSYYDQVQDFQYDSEKRTVQFSMPFDWSEKNLEQIFILHEEIRVPKNLPDLLATKYDVTVNGILMAEEDVVIDDYSYDDRTVHLILQKEDLMSVREEAIKISNEKIDFTFKPSSSQEPSLTAATSSLMYKVNLSWTPTKLQSETTSRFYIDIEENFVPSKEEYSVPYYFVLNQDGNEIFRKKTTAQVHAEPNTNFIDYTFSPSQEGAVTVLIEAINDQFLSNADFAIVVEPKEELINPFPKTLTSQILDESGKIIEGKYDVDLTWFSNPLAIDEESEFIITIYEKGTDIPVFQSEYDLVLIQNDEEIYRTSGFASSGGSFENYIFSKKNLGDITLRIENIDESSEFVEIPLVVTPEFPLGSLIILTVGFPLLIILFRLKTNLFSTLQI